MGRGRSGAGGGAGGGGANSISAGGANTPSGISHAQFMAMSEQQRFQTINNIIADQSITVPSYLDGSDTTKVMYALGMNNKPTVVSDSQLDNIQGREVFRTVYEKGSMPPPSSDAILDQVRNGDYTQMSGNSTSIHGRALYFATDFTESALYGDGYRNAMVMRSKINPNAKIARESTLRSQMSAKGFNPNTSNFKDDMALYALSQGIDGWYSGSYTMLVNRGCLTSSSTNKRISKRNTKGVASLTASSWQEAAIAR